MVADAQWALHERVVARSRALLKMAESHYGRPIPAPEIRFDLRGQAAGQARIAPGRISLLRYNPALLAANVKDFLVQTVAHEVAHLVAFEVFGRHIRPHGVEWQAVMRLFGVPPQRCHSYVATESDRRRLARHTYHCGCRTHELSSIRHNRIAKGQQYLCRACGQPLRPGGRTLDASRPESR